MTCPKCQTKLAADVDITGGCTGGHPEGSYCYCDSVDLTVDMICPNMKCPGKSKRTRIHVITDRYALERYMTNHYQPKDSA